MVPGVYPNCEENWCPEVTQVQSSWGKGAHIGGKAKGFPPGIGKSAWGKDGERRETQRKKARGRATGSSSASATIVEIGATRKIGVPRKRGRPMARERGKVAARPNVLPTMSRKSKTPRINVWAIWKDPLNARAGSSEAWTRQGALRNPPWTGEESAPGTNHTEGAGQEENGIPEIVFDYAFLGVDGERAMVAVFSIHDRRAGLLFAHVVPRSGLAHENGSQQMMKDIAKLGYYEVLCKCDRERALRSVQEEPQRRKGGADACGQLRSWGMGGAERAVQSLGEQVRVL